MDLKELNPAILENVTGGNKAEAEEYIQTLFEKYNISTYAELMRVWTYKEKNKYLDIYLDTTSSLMD